MNKVHKILEIIPVVWLIAAITFYGFKDSDLDSEDSLREYILSSKNISEDSTVQQLITNARDMFNNHVAEEFRVTFFYSDGGNVELGINDHIGIRIKTDYYELTAPMSFQYGRIIERDEDGQSHTRSMTREEIHAYISSVGEMLDLPELIGAEFSYNPMLTTQGGEEYSKNVTLSASDFEQVKGFVREQFDHFAFDSSDNTFKT